MESSRVSVTVLPSVFTNVYTATGLERVLAPNTTYTLVVTNNSADPCKISIFVTYYEGELSSLN